MMRCPVCSYEFPDDPLKLPLTARQAAILEYIRTYGEQHGYMPLFTEIANAFGLRSLATVHEHLMNLERKGHIRRLYNESRAAVLL